MKEYFNENYWDCECEHDYIHPKSEKFCPKCGAVQDRAPDSITSEVEEYYAYKKRMTPAEYCKNLGSLCPHCKSGDIGVMGCYETQDSVTYQPVKCNNCGKCWTDTYGLIGYEEYDESGRY